MINLLLLIAHIAQLALRLIGEAAKAQQLDLQLMSTGRKHRPEISVMALARRLITDTAMLHQLLDPWRYLHTLRMQVANAINHAILFA